MKYIVFVVFVYAYNSLGVEVPEECDKLGILAYEEIGCKPEYANAQKCPSHFTCKDYKTDPNYCNFQGHVYKLNEAISNDLTLKSCMVGCHCQGSNTLSCAILDCPEWLGVRLPNHTCYRTYEIDKCCSTGFKCEPYENLATCTLEGKLYREGQKMYPEDRCYVCTCQKGFKGLIEEPFCRRLRCAFEKNNAHVFADNCALVYGKKAACCANGYACPTGNETFITVKQTTEHKCKYGDQLLNVGDSFERQVETLGGTHTALCKCQVPPLVNCFTDEPY